MATIISIRHDIMTLPVMICSLCSKLCLTTIRLSVLDLATLVAAESVPSFETSKESRDVKESPDGRDGMEGSLKGEDVATARGVWSLEAEKAWNGRTARKRRRAEKPVEPAKPVKPVNRAEAASGRDRCRPKGIA
jgi:hypothetical protein